MASCAHLAAGPGSEDRLKKRVTAGWQAKIDGNCGTLYDMTTGEFRKTMSRKDFSSLCNTKIENFKIGEIGISGEPRKEAVVSVSYQMKFQGFPFDLEARQKWVWENGDWFLDPAQTMTPMN